MATSQGIKLDDEVGARLKALAKKRDRSPHWLMRTAIERYLDQEEQYELEMAEDMAEWEDYLLTGVGIHQDIVEAWLTKLADNTTGKVIQAPK
jgi:predicted transcriptional regulator